MHDRGLTKDPLIAVFFTFSFNFSCPSPPSTHCSCVSRTRPSRDAASPPQQQATHAGICLASQCFAAMAKLEADASERPETLNLEFLSVVV